MQFGVLLEHLNNYPPESLYLLFLSIKASTPSFGKDNTYQLTISSESFPLYLYEVNERMRNFLYEYVFDVGGHVKTAFHTSGARLESLWLKFPADNSAGILTVEETLFFFVPCLCRRIRRKRVLMAKKRI